MDGLIAFVQLAYISKQVSAQRQPTPRHTRTEVSLNQCQHFTSRSGISEVSLVL